MRVLLFMVCLVTSCLGAEQRIQGRGWEGYAFVRGVPRSVHLLKSPAIRDDLNIDFAMGDLYEVSLSDVTVVRGEVDTSHLKVALMANHREILTSGDELAVLLKVEGAKLTVLYWSFTAVVACVPGEVLDEMPFEKDFGLHDEELGMSCVRAEVFH